MADAIYEFESKYWVEMRENWNKKISFWIFEISWYGTRIVIKKWNVIPFSATQ